MGSLPKSLGAPLRLFRPHAYLLPAPGILLDEPVLFESDPKLNVDSPILTVDVVLVDRLGFGVPVLISSTSGNPPTVARPLILPPSPTI